MNTVELEYPFRERAVRQLEVGQHVRVRGEIFTGRDRFHKHLFEDGKSPVDLADGAIYHCGPLVAGKPGAWDVRAAGPTTSMRQELYMPAIIARHRVRVIIGKGGMGEGTRRACDEHGCVYLQVVGGAAPVLAECVRDVLGVHLLREFGPAEAVWHLAVHEMEAVVAIDTSGRSLTRRIRTSSRRRLRTLI